MRRRFIATLLFVGGSLAALSLAFVEPTSIEREADPAKLDQIRAGAPIPVGAWNITTNPNTKCVNSGVPCDFINNISCSVLGIG
jgi:hypothetical protein